MDPKLFQQQLESLAELKWDDDNQCWRVKSFKTKLQDCERCALTRPACRVDHTLYQTPYPHWRSNCKGCLCYLDPYTQKPIKGEKAQTVNTINSLVRQHYYETGRVKKPKSGRFAKRPKDTVVESTEVTASGWKDVEDYPEATITHFYYLPNK